MFLCLQFDLTILFLATFFVIVTESDGMGSPRRRVHPGSEVESAAANPRRAPSFNKPEVPPFKDLCNSKDVQEGSSAADQACKEYCLVLSNYVTALKACSSGESADDKYLKPCTDLEDGTCEKRRYRVPLGGYKCQCVQKESKAIISPDKCKSEIRKSKAFLDLEDAWKLKQRSAREGEANKQRSRSGGCFGSANNFRSNSYHGQGQNYQPLSGGRHGSFNRVGLFTYSSSSDCERGYYHHSHHSHHHHQRYHHPKMDVGECGEKCVCNLCPGNNRCSQACNRFCGRAVGFLICFFQG